MLASNLFRTLNDLSAAKLHRCIMFVSFTRFQCAPAYLPFAATVDCLVGCFGFNDT